MPFTIMHIKQMASNKIITGANDINFVDAGYRFGAHGATRKILYDADLVWRVLGVISCVWVDLSLVIVMDNVICARDRVMLHEYLRWDLFICLVSQRMHT